MGMANGMPYRPSATVASWAHAVYHATEGPRTTALKIADLEGRNVLDLRTLGTGSPEVEDRAADVRTAKGIYVHAHPGEPEPHAHSAPVDVLLVAADEAATQVAPTAPADVSTHLPGETGPVLASMSPRSHAGPWLTAPPASPLFFPPPVPPPSV